MKELSGIPYNIGVSVLKFDGKFRQIQVGLLFSEKHGLIQSGINPCQLSYSQVVIEQIKMVLNGEIGEYEWGCGERVCFTSTQTETTVLDNFEWEPNYDVSTATLCELLQIRIDAMTASKEGYIELIIAAFEQFKETQNGKTHIPPYDFYEMVEDTNNLKLVMVLESSDFGLDKAQFRDQLRFNEWIYG